MSAVVFVRKESEPALPPPPGSIGVWALWKERLFADTTTSFLTVIGAVLLGFILYFAVDFFIVRAIWVAPDGRACALPGAGACWAFIVKKAPYFIYGAYPDTQVWRVNIVLALGAFLIGWLLARQAPGHTFAGLLFFVFFPVFAFVLLHGSPTFGLPIIPTDVWGGLFVTLLIAVTGIVASLPAGIILALGRQSKLPVTRTLSIGFIEFTRGVPMILVLFMANLVLPLFLPEGWSPDRLLRPMVGVAIFEAAYLAEVIRGGLQAMPKGQTEGAMALGLNYQKTMRLVIMPQVLKISIPDIVNTFIALFKDTTLVSIVGIFDFLMCIEAARKDPNWAGPTIALTGYAFAAMVYFVFCFGMSRYSQKIERDLERGRSH